MSPVRMSRVTPGVSNANSMKLRPLTGSSLMRRSLTVLLTAVRLVSTSGASEVTFISCDWPATLNTSERSGLPPTVTLTDDLICAKPCLSAVISYVPTGSTGKLNSPWSLEVDLYSAPLAAFLAVKFAPETTAPVASVTVPWMAPPASDCANVNEPASKITSRHTNKGKRFLYIRHTLYFYLPGDGGNPLTTSYQSCCFKQIKLRSF